MSDQNVLVASTFALVFPDGTSAAFLKKADIPGVTAKVADHKLATSKWMAKHITNYENKELSFEIAYGQMGKYLVDAINQSYRGTVPRLNLGLSVGNFDGEEISRYDLGNCLISEVTVMPALDASNSEAMYTTLKVVPGHVTKSGGSGKVAGEENKHAKNVHAANFRVDIQGLQASEYITKIDAVTLKQTVDKQYIGRHRDPIIHAAATEGSGELSVTFLMTNRAAYDELAALGQTFMQRGESDSSKERYIAVELLDSTGQKTIGEIKFDGCGMTSFDPGSSTAGEGKVMTPTAKFYFEQVTITGLS